MSAINSALEKFEIFLLGKDEITVRTDCEAIVRFYDNMITDLDRGRTSIKRWLKFAFNLQTKGYRIHFEYLEGKENGIADTLSRYISKPLTPLFTHLHKTKHSSNMARNAHSLPRKPKGPNRDYQYINI